MNKYILEIKNRFILIIFNWIFLFLVSYFYKETVMFIIIKPCYTIDDSILSVNYFIFTGITELFSTYVFVSKFVTNQVCFIFIMFNFLNFLVPALYPSEYLVFMYLFGQTFIILVISYYFFYKILFPMLLVFFLGFHSNAGKSDVLEEVLKNNLLHFEARVSEYIDFYVNTYYSCVLNLQLLFFLITILFYFNSTNFLGIRYFRKISYVLFLFIATLMTPPDVTSQLITFLFLLIIFEISLFTNCIKNSIQFLVRQPIETY